MPSANAPWRKPLSTAAVIFELVGRSSAMGRVAGGKHAALWVTHNFHADGNVADANAKIDERLPFPDGVPAVDIVGAGFKFKRGRDPVASLIFIIARLLAVFMEVDKTGGDN